MRRSLIVQLALLPLAACSLLSPLDDLQSGGGPSTGVDSGGSGGGGSSAGGESSGGEPSAGGGGGSGGDTGAGGSGPTNLLMNPGFESGVNGCGSGWSGGYGATYAQSTIARSGANSCLACAEPVDVSSFGIEPTNPISLPAGTYYAEAWIRAPEDGYPVAGLTGVVMAIEGRSGDPTYFQGTQVSPDLDWVASTHTFTLDAPDQLTFQVHAFFPEGGCVLVDDVALYAE